MSLEGWEEGVRVQVFDPRILQERIADPVDPRDGQLILWPSKENPKFYLEFLSEAEAASIASEARTQFVYWLAGQGLNPVDILYRWMMGAGRLDPHWIVGDDVIGILHHRAKWERWVVARVFPSDDDVSDRTGRRSDLARVARTRAEMARISGLLSAYSNGGKYAVMRDERSIYEMVDWVSAECLDAATESAMVEARLVATHAMESMCRWISQDGDGLLGICQRVYGLIFERYGMLAPGMSGHDLAALLGQVRATFCEMTKRFFEKPLEIQLGFVPKVTGQKSAAASEVYRENAARICPKRQLGGDAGVSDDSRRAVNEGLKEREARKLEEARRMAREREEEREAQEFQELMRRQKAARAARNVNKEK